MALGFWLYILPRGCRAAGADLFGQLADLDIAVDVEAGSTSSWPCRSWPAGWSALPIGRCCRPRRSAKLKLQRRRDACCVSTALYFIRSRWPFVWRPHCDACVDLPAAFSAASPGCRVRLPTLWASIRGWTKISAAAFSRIFNGTVAQRRADPAGRHRFR